MRLCSELSAVQQVLGTASLCPLKPTLGGKGGGATSPSTAGAFPAQAPDPGRGAGTTLPAPLLRTAWLRSCKETSRPVTNRIVARCHRSPVYSSHYSNCDDSGFGKSGAMFTVWCRGPAHFNKPVSWKKAARYEDACGLQLAGSACRWGRGSSSCAHSAHPQGAERGSFCRNIRGGKGTKTENNCYCFSRLSQGRFLRCVAATQRRRPPHRGPATLGAVWTRPDPGHLPPDSGGFLG